MATTQHRRRRKKRAPERTPEQGSTPPSRPRRAGVEIACWTVLLAAAVGALAWKHYTTFFLSWTDEQIHFYVARRMAEGAVLYRDIGSARPPLVLAPLAWLIRLGCSPLSAGRALVLGSQLATAALLVWGGRRLGSWRVGLLAALLFLTSPESFSRIHYTGIQLVALSASTCVLFSLAAQPLLSGLAFGLSLGTGQHGLVVCGMAAVLTIVRRPRDGLPFAAGTFITSALVYGSVWASGGRHLWENLAAPHLFHLRLGQGADIHFWELFKPWLGEHAYLFAEGGLAAVLSRTSRLMGARVNKCKSSTRENVPKPLVSRSARGLLLIVGAHITVVLAMADAPFLYIVVVAPLLALLAAMGFDAMVVWWRQPSLTGARRSPHLLVVGAAALLALTVGGWSAARAHREDLDQRRYSFWPHVLHGQVSRFHQLDATLVSLGSRLPETGTIFGDPTIISALALYSGRRVSGELADWNPSWIEAGAVRREHVVARIERDGVTAVVTPPWFLVQDPYFRSYLIKCYQKPSIVIPAENAPGEGLPDILVFLHVPTSPCGAWLP